MLHTSALIMEGTSRETARQRDGETDGGVEGWRDEEGAGLK